MTRLDRLIATLDDFLRVAPYIEAAIIATPDGYPIVSAVPDTIDDRRLAAMSTAVMVLGERAADEMDRGEIHHVYVEGTRGHTILMPAGPAAMLCVTTYPSARVGLVLYEMHRSARLIAEVMPEDSLRVVTAEAPPVVDIREQEAHTNQ
jgi:uncharacterized protein